MSMMMKYTVEEIQKTKKMIASMIKRCEKAQLKFAEGTSQYALLKNRLKALYISMDLIENKANTYTKEDLLQALVPISSILHKCEKGQSKFKSETTNYIRFENMIEVMYIAKAYIDCKLLHIDMVS